FQTPPYNHPVSGGLHPGMAVYIEGTVPKKATRFGMNFAYGRDIILHFNPRFHYRKIVLNSCQSGKWGKEESSKLPFQKGEHFEAVFIVSLSLFTYTHFNHFDLLCDSANSAQLLGGRCSSVVRFNFFYYQFCGRGLFGGHGLVIM
uniref:Galectin n=1 Tax=Laticauda laticaudata TaxID=8630 RepID=A0A8C5RTJ9_LATLA